MNAVVVRKRDQAGLRPLGDVVDDHHRAAELRRVTAREQPGQCPTERGELGPRDLDRLGHRLGHCFADGHLVARGLLEADAERRPLLGDRHLEGLEPVAALHDDVDRLPARGAGQHVDARDAFGRVDLALPDRDQLVAEHHPRGLRRRVLAEAVDDEVLVRTANAGDHEHPEQDRHRGEVVGRRPPEQHQRPRP